MKPASIPAVINEVKTNVVEMGFIKNVEYEECPNGETIAITLDDDFGTEIVIYGASLDIDVRYDKTETKVVRTRKSIFDNQEK